MPLVDECGDLVRDFPYQDQYEQNIFNFDDKDIMEGSTNKNSTAPS